MDDESGNCSGSGNSGSGSVIAGSERKRSKMGEEEQNLDEAIAEIVAVIDDQNKMIGMLINMNNTLDFIIVINLLISNIIIPRTSSHLTRACTSRRSSQTRRKAWSNRISLRL